MTDRIDEIREELDVVLKNRNPIPSDPIRVAEHYRETPLYDRMFDLLAHIDELKKLPNEEQIAADHLMDRLVEAVAELGEDFEGWKKGCICECDACVEFNDDIHQFGTKIKTAGMEVIHS